MLEFDDVRFSVGSFTLRVDRRVERGSRVAILGASGSGKSTLLSATAGFIAPQAGSLRWNGRSLDDTGPARRPMSILFQDGNLFPHLSVAQNVGLALRTDLRLSSKDRARVSETIARVGLDGMADRRPSDLSGGQQSRAALARLLLQDRPVALLDEPFAALDPGLRSEMLRLLDELCTELGLTLLLSTHDLRDAERLCDRIWVLEEGNVAFDGPTEGIRDAAPAILRDWM